VNTTPPENPLPSRRDRQRKEALTQANEVRSARSLLKEQLKGGEVSLASLIIDYPDYLANARINDLVEALPGYGALKAGKLLSACRISPSKTVAGLTPGQRQALFEALSK
jgi:hypothetical protein